MKKGKKENNHADQEMADRAMVEAIKARSARYAHISDLYRDAFNQAEVAAELCRRLTPTLRERMTGTSLPHPLVHRSAR